MRKLLIIIFLANLILLAVSLVLLPSEVAIHFRKGGVPDSWASKEANAIIFIAIEFPMFALFFFAPSLTLGFPKRFISLPNKNYWLSEENLPKFKTIFTSLMTEFGIVFFIFFLCVKLLAIGANLADPIRLNEGIFLTIFIAFMLYTVYWCVKLILAFRVPKNN